MKLASLFFRFRYSSGYITSIAIFSILPALIGVLPCTVHAKDILSFGHTLETATTVVHFHLEDESLAYLIAEILDYAHASIGETFGYVPSQIATYIYRTNSEMSEGLRQMLSYTPWEIDAILRVGISACTQYTFHIHRRVARRHNFLWHAVLDEYVQGVTEVRFGTAPAHSATWIEEGVSSFIANKVLMQKLPAFEKWFLVWNYKIAFKALVSGKLPRLVNISTRRQWYTNITHNRTSWNNQYATAFIGVLYIVEQYGFETIELILAKVKGGIAYSRAMQQILGLSLDQFESRMRLWLFLKGIFDLYLKYTVLLIILVGLGAVLTFIWFGRR